MNSPDVTAQLFEALLDDAALYPPAAMAMPTAVRGHREYRRSWYADAVGPFVCAADRLDELADHVDEHTPVAVVTDGVASVPRALTRISGLESLDLAALEMPLRGRSVVDVVPMLSGMQIPAFVELPVAQVTDEDVRVLASAGLRIKLRTGGTSAESFPAEHHLADALMRCVQQELAFKCTAGLHHPVRHLDPDTGFEHHGFLNVVLAVHAAVCGGAAAARAALCEQDTMAVSAQIRSLSKTDIETIRGRFTSFGTCSISEPIRDLVAMGLVAAP